MTRLAIVYLQLEHNRRTIKRGASNVERHDVLTFDCGLPAEAPENIRSQMKLQIRCTPAEKKAWQAAARANGLTLTAWLKEHASIERTQMSARTCRVALVAARAGVNAVHESLRVRDTENAARLASVQVHLADAMKELWS
jgi:hypothetical protein